MTTKELFTEEEIGAVIDCVDVAIHNGFWRWFDPENVHIRSFLYKLGLDEEEIADLLNGH